MLDFGCANAERQRAKRTVGGGVRIAAYHRHAGQRQPRFGTDDVNDALTDIAQLEFGDAVFRAIGIKRFHLQTRHRIGDALRTIGGRHVMVGHGNRRIDATRRAVGQLQAFERLRAGDFMHQMAIDIEQRSPVIFDVYHMSVPQFLK